MSALFLRVPGFVAPTNCTGEFVPVVAMKAYMGSRIIAPSILNFGARSRLVFSITFRSFYLKTECRYPLNGRLGGPQNSSVNFREKSLSTAVVLIPDHPACSLVPTPNTLS